MNQVIIKKQTWWQLLSIQAGGVICLPVIMVGQLLCQKFGLVAAFLAVGIGNIFLLFIGYLIANLSSEKHLSTVEHAIRSFGNYGRFIFSLLMMFSMLGWFAIQLNVMTLSLEQLFGMLKIDISSVILNIIVGTFLSSILCFFGMKAIKVLSNFIAPLLGLTLLYAIFFTPGSIAMSVPFSFSWIGGISLIIGANIAAVIDIPTFFRHARSKKDAQICILFLYGLIVPIIEGIGIYLTAISNGNSILSILQSGHGLIWMTWISCFVFLSGWATNNTNLYSALTSSYSFAGKDKTILRTLILGSFGTILACFNLLGNLEKVLDLISITIGAMGSVILSNYILEKRIEKYKKNSWISIVSWFSGVSIGLSTLFFQIFLTGVSAFGAFLVTFATQFILNYLTKRKSNYETINN